MKVVNNKETHISEIENDAACSFSNNAKAFLALSLSI